MINAVMSRPRHRLAGVAVLGVLAYWLAAKISNFHALLYFGDLFINLQISRSLWLEKPLFFNYAYFPDPLVHNFFLLPLLAPLTIPFAANGLFFFSAAALFCAFNECMQLTKLTHSRDQSLVLLLLLVACLFGPMSIWIWDNSGYGWNTESLYLPFSLAFGAAVLRHSRRAWLWGALLITVREDGALLAWAIHAICAIVKPAADEGGERLTRQLLRLSFWWAAVFACGMLIQAAVSGPSTVRLSRVLSRFAALVDSSPLLREVALMLAEYCALLVAVVLFVRFVRLNRRLVAALVPFLLLSAVQLLSVLHYPIPLIRSYGLSWPTHFAGLWGGACFLAICGTLFGYRTLGDGSAQWTRLLIPGLVFILSLLWQTAILKEVRFYDCWLFFRTPFREQEYAPRRSLSVRELRFLECLGRTLPATATVRTHAALFALFQRQDYTTFDSASTRTYPPVLSIGDTHGRFADRARPDDLNAPLALQVDSLSVVVHDVKQGSAAVIKCESAS